MRAEHFLNCFVYFALHVDVVGLTLSGCDLRVDGFER